MDTLEQAEFLLAEYKQIHESLYKGLDNLNTTLRLTTTLFAASIASVLVAFNNNAPAKIILAYIGSLGTFFLIVCCLGFVVLLASLKSVLRKIRAVNCIRRFFLDQNAENARYFKLPITDREPRFQKLSGHTSLRFSQFFAALFSAISGGCWSCYFVCSPTVVFLSATGLPLATVLLLEWGLFRTRRSINNETDSKAVLTEVPIRTEVDEDCISGENRNGGSG